MSAKVVLTWFKKGVKSTRIRPYILYCTSKYLLLDCFFKNTAVIPEYNYDINKEHEPNKFTSAEDLAIRVNSHCSIQIAAKYFKNY